MHCCSLANMQLYQLEVDRISASASVSAPNVDNGYFQRTFSFGGKQSYHIRYTFGFGVQLLVNSVVAESRIQSLSCGGRECTRRRESLASLCTEWLCKDNRGSWLYCLRLHLVLWPVGPDRLALMTLSTFGFGFRPKIPLYFRWNIRFRRMCYATFGLLSVSAESKTSTFGRISIASMP